MKLRAFVFAFVAGATFASAAEADVFDGLKDTNPCRGPDGQRFVSIQTFVDHLARANGVVWQSDMQTSSLGTLALQASQGTCRANRAACDARRALFIAGREIVSAPPSSPDFAVEVRVNVTDDTVNGYTESFLNDDNAGWFSVRCLGAAPPPPPAASTTGEDRPSTGQVIARYLDGVVIGRTEADLRRAFGDREFATVGVAEDRVADGEVWNVDAFAGFPLVLDTFQPFIGVQRKRDERAGVLRSDVDDITFGVLRTFAPRFGDDTHFVTVRLEWETDSDFDSSASTVAVTWEPILEAVPCLGRYVSVQFRLRCEARLVTDYVNIDDPGGKLALQIAPDFWRAGFDIGLAYDLSPPGRPAGTLMLTTSYARRDDLEGSDGDADLLRSALVLSTGKDGHFSLGLEYAQGEDLSSLGPQQTLSLKFGYRR